MHDFMNLLRREMALCLRDKQSILMPIIILLIIVSIFPLTLIYQPQLIQKTAPGIIWFGIIFTHLLSFTAIYRGDFEDGSLEQLILKPYSMVAYVYSKVIVHLIMTALPGILITLLLAIMLDISMHTTEMLVISILLGVSALSFVSSILAALTLGLRHSNILFCLLALPLYIPIIIFAAGCANHDAHYLSGASFLAAILIVSAVLAPYVSAYTLRLSLSE